MEIKNAILSDTDGLRLSDILYRIMPNGMGVQNTLQNNTNDVRV